MHITLQQIKSNFDTTTFARGYQYYLQKRIKSTEFDVQANVYNASVSGSGNRTYFLSVFMQENAVKSVCSCPVAYQCKHGVAASLTFLDMNNSATALKEDEPQQVAVPLPSLPPSNIVPIKKRQPEIKSAFDCWLDKTNKDVITAGQDTEKSEDCLHYILSEYRGNLCVEIRRPKRLKTGLLSKGQRISMRRMQEISYGYTDESQSDQLVADSMEFDYYGSTYEYLFNDPAKLSGLFAMIETGRCHSLDINSAAFTLNQVKKSFHFAWSEKAPYKLSILLGKQPLPRLLNSMPLTYIDIDRREAGYVDSMLKYPLLQRLQALPALPEKDALHFIIWAKEHALDIPMPKGITIDSIAGEFQPALTIDHDGKAFYAQYHFSYGDFKCQYGQYPLQASMLVERDGQLYQWDRALEKEQQAHDLLFLQAKFSVNNELLDDQLQAVLRQDDAFFWASFSDITQPDLIAQGWIVNIESAIALPQVIDVQEMNGEIESDEYDDWFQLGLSIDINGKKVDLVPLLLNALLQVDDWQAMPESLYFPYQGNYLNISKQQLQPILKILQELTDDKGRIPRFHASVINDIPFVNEWSGDQKIQRLADKLADFSGIEAVPAPLQLQAELRDYQQQGLNWLNFLHEYGFGGILADDMGLGKTVQALAMMQLLLERKQLKKPIMVVCPTSLVANWRNEAAKFTPDLNVLVLHGANRKKLFEQIDKPHLVITTYPLIHRDFDTLSQIQFQWLILDEAQVIKNPKAKMTQSVKQLKAQHKLCLTGTPMENHLGELWSLFDFLMPGYLSNNKGFNDLYRKPIESGEHYAQEWLNKRINPFLLRRTKDAVATELPAKTEIIQSVTLAKEQRILYESIRVTMEKKVRELLKEKGLAKSQIEFLDALLKLRQACCHPKLVKLDEAKKVKNSAKLEFLLEVLPDMLEEGRKVLIFSQFTQMLQIIESALHDINIKTTKLTGQTRKREEAIDKFGRDGVNVFLISLKAGGVGLNLTAADTVIHFDPWWNPAAENQATDRAYRIGQDKPVFVYKLVTENTIEERVLELQRTKQAMADSVYGSKAQKQKAQLSSMDANQLLSLFE